MLRFMGATAVHVNLPAARTGLEHISLPDNAPRFLDAYHRDVSI